MSNLTQLQEKPDAALVAELRKLLSLAESGQLRACVFLTVFTGREIGTGWTGHFVKADMFWALHLLNHKLATRAMSDEPRCPIPTQ